MSTPSTEQLKQAIAISEQIEKLQAELASVLSGSFASSTVTSTSPAPVKSTRGGKRTMSPATIAKMRAAQQARWAKKKGVAAVTAVETAVENVAKGTRKVVKKAKRNLSPEGRARIVAALKARWASKKAPTTKVAAPAKKKTKK